MTEIQRITERLKQVFNGDPWYGYSLMHKLETLDFTKVNNCPEGVANSVARLVCHITNWRVFTVEKLKGNEAFDIEINSQDDWPDVQISSEQEWQEILEKLKDSQSQLLAIIENENDDFLDQKMKGRKYTMRMGLEGIIQHDIYHQGQIAVVARQVM